MLFLGLLSVPEEPPAYDGMSDEKLLIQAGKGDKEAFHRLYENTYRTVYSYILSIAKILSESAAKDGRRLLWCDLCWGYFLGLPSFHQMLMSTGWGGGCLSAGPPQKVLIHPQDQA